MSGYPSLEFSLEEQLLASLTQDDEDARLQQKRVQYPRYDPYTQTTQDFDIQVGPLFNAPAFQNISISGPRPRILDLLHEPVPEPLSLHHSRRRGKSCGRGHLHMPWPQRGGVVVEKCERFCFFCGLEVQTAATLRKVCTRVPPLDEELLT